MRLPPSPQEGLSIHIGRPFTLKDLRLTLKFMGRKAGITKVGDKANSLVDCHFCEGVGLHFGKDCGACEGTGEERVRKQKQKLYNAKISYQ